VTLKKRFNFIHTGILSHPGTLLIFISPFILAGVFPAEGKREGELVKRFGFGTDRISLYTNTIHEDSLPPYAYTIYDLR
jgi:hypothetical protein